MLNDFNVHGLTCCRTLLFKGLVHLKTPPTNDAVNVALTCKFQSFRVILSSLTIHPLSTTRGLWGWSLYQHHQEKAESLWTHHHFITGLKYRDNNNRPHSHSQLQEV